MKNLIFSEKEEDWCKEVEEEEEEEEEEVKKKWIA